MATLSSGVLLKLIRDMKSSSSSSYLSDDNDDISSLLQVTGIVPSLSNSNLFPDRGFYLQVSDSSHSTYISLPPGHDDLILSDNLQLGQFILVHHLEPSSPVPILHFLHLIPGRHPFPKRTTAIPAMSEKKKCKIRSCPVSPVLKRTVKIGAEGNDEESDWSDKSSVVTSISNSSSMIPRPKTVRKSWEADGRMRDRKREEKPIRKSRSSTVS